MTTLDRFRDYTREQLHDLFEPETVFRRSVGTWGIQGIVPIRDRAGDFAFFVTEGRRQGDHVFDEGITTEGVLTWQSQPKQRLGDTTIKQLIAHDDARHSIYLFLRTRKDVPYTYIGRLRYLSHDAVREQPVHFQWQILDWDLRTDQFERIGLQLDHAVEPTVGALERRDGLLQRQPPAPRERVGSQTNAFRAQKRPDRPEYDARNRALGLAGELAVIADERERLLREGRGDLAAAIRHIADVEGDGAGYDVRSFRANGEPLYIEVKTTRGAAETSFFISSNEVAFADQHAANYALYRLYEFDPNTGRGFFFVLSGSASASCSLVATQFRADAVRSNGPLLSVAFG